MASIDGNEKPGVIVGRPGMSCRIPADEDSRRAAHGEFPALLDCMLANVGNFGLRFLAGKEIYHLGCSRDTSLVEAKYYRVGQHGDRGKHLRLLIEFTRPGTHRL